METSIPPSSSDPMAPRDPDVDPTVEVLLVEDNPADAYLVAEFLSAATRPRIRLRTAQSLKEGLTDLARAAADVVLLDLTLPDAEGLTALDRALAEAPETPILVITGRGDLALASAAAVRGAEDYLIKGEFTAFGLTRAIRYALERRRARQALAASQTRLQALYDNATAALLIADDAGRFLAANPAAEELLGRTRAQILATTVSQVLAGGGEDFEKLWRAFLAAGRHEGDVTLRRPDGGEVEAQHRAVANFLPGEHLSILTDITLRREAEQRLRRSEERYRRFFEEDLTGDVVAAPDGRIVACNPEFAKMFGFESPVHALGFLLKNLFTEPGEWVGILRHLRAGRKVEHVELTARHRDGRRVFVVCNAVGNYDESGGLVDVFAYLFDNTDRHKATERLRLASRMEAVGQLAGGIAHDFNNLITVITGYTESLLSGLGADDPSRHQLQAIQQAGMRAADLTHQLLAFSRQQVLRPRRIDLNVIVGDVESMLRRVIGEDVELTTVLATSLGPVHADPGQLHQVILNLAINAREAMPEDGRLLVETAEVDLDEAYREEHEVVVPGPYVMLAVTDTGHGMDESTRARIFEPFFTTREGGTGLGLSTVYGIVKQSGGYVWVYSEPGQGTTFKVYMPRHEPQEAPPAETGVPAAATVTGSETLLVVEDSDAVRVLVGEILRPQGYTVIETATGQAAREVFADAGRRIDLVLSDVVMPDVRGPDLERELSAIRPGTRFLFMSGWAGKAVVREGILARDAPFIEKPFGSSALLRKVREVLDGPPPRPPLP